MARAPVTGVKFFFVCYIQGWDPPMRAPVIVLVHHSQPILPHGASRTPVPTRFELAATRRLDGSQSHLRKVRVKHLVAQQAAYTLRIRMPCTHTGGCNGCIIAQDMSADRGSTRTGLVLVWNERRHKCALQLEQLEAPSPSAGIAATQAIDPPNTVTPGGIQAALEADRRA